MFFYFVYDIIIINLIYERTFFMLDNNNNENNEMDSISSDFSYESERKQLENTSSLIRLWAFLIVIIGLYFG